MPEDLGAALAAVRQCLLGDDLVRAVATGRRRGASVSVRRAEVRPVDLRGGRRLQIVTTAPDAAPITRNVAGPAAQEAIDALLREAFGSWHVETQTEIRQLRVTKSGQAQVHVARTSRRGVEARPVPHDRVKARLIDPDDPLFAVLHADADKRRQVDAFLRQLEPLADRALTAAERAGRPVHVVDLGCGNAYLTFAAHRYLLGRAGARGLGVRTIGIDVRPDIVARDTDRAGRAGLAGLRFVVGTIGDADPRFEAPPVEGDPQVEVGPAVEVDIVLALHACDTATDDALARAVAWRAPVVLAAPCCHHDVQRQWAQRRAGGRSDAVPAPYGALMRHAILRERFADVLTDALRAGILRRRGYRVDVVEFVDSRHTPRNALLRAELLPGTPGPGTGGTEGSGAGAGGPGGIDAERDDARELAAIWGVTPRLEQLLTAT